MPAATRLPGRLLAYDVSPAIVTRWLPCTLTPWNWLSWVVDPRSELSELLKNRTPMERFAEDVTPRTEVWVELSTVTPCAPAWETVRSLRLTWDVVSR